MIGVLLAGGAATRLPNKPLLPQRDFSPVCFSGMEYLLRHQVSHINVVTSPNSVVVDIIDEHYRPLIDLVFTYQEEPTGVGDAINLVDRQSYKINGYCTDDMMIVMADNIYPRHEHLELNLESFKYDKMAIVRGVSAWRLPHLVRIGKDNRPTRTGPGRLALSTP
jgi:dTDP-glucose pyrophosphorylase